MRKVRVATFMVRVYNLDFAERVERMGIRAFRKETMAWVIPNTLPGSNGEIKLPDFLISKHNHVDKMLTSLDKSRVCEW